jgi:glycosyltransferase involved in cell wall biosynthesis
VRRPTVSVLLPTYNRDRFIVESLESIFAQTLAPTQLIVINDGSTDSTRSALEPFRQRVEYLECKNSGKPNALNLGMPRVTGEYVWIMDDDDVALADALERHVALLESRPELGWTYSSYIESTSSGENGRVAPQAEKMLPDFPETEFLIRLMEECFLIHPTILVRASCYRQVGPFQTELIRCQDYEMAVRLARAFTCARVAGPTIYHRVHEGSRGSAKDTFEAGQIQEKWLEYMQIFFRRLRQEMPLSEYLPSFQTGDGQTCDTRHAYLRRMTIMARKRLYDEMIEDLALAQQDTVTKCVLSTAERYLLYELFHYKNDPLLFMKFLVRRIRSVCRGPVGTAFRCEFVRCLYWRAIAGARRGDYADVFSALSAALHLSGIGVLRSLLRGKKPGLHPT